jgi:DNA-binding PadR family transcriptional regulator
MYSNEEAPFRGRRRHRHGAPFPPDFEAEDEMTEGDPRRGRGGPPRRGHHGRGRRFAGDPTGSFFGRGPRASRGDIRAAILALLEEQPRHGYQIIQELAERTGGVWRPSPGSVYPTLQHLEEEGLIAAEEQEGKRVFRLTEAGQEVAASRGAAQTKPWDEVGADVDDALFDLRDIARQLAIAVRQVAHAGSASQVEAAKKLLVEARKGLYRILAEDGD